MSENIHPFLRIEIFKFQVNNNKQTIDLSKVKTEIEIKDKNCSSQSCMCFYYYKSIIFFLISTNKKTIV